MKNTLIDNSDKLKLVETLKELLSNPKCNRLLIATGYWDIPGTTLLYDELKAFFERGGKMQLLIGKEPQLRAYQTLPPKEDEKRFPDFYIKRDIDRLTDTYKPAVQLLIDYAPVDTVAESQIRIHVYGQDGEEQFLHAKCYITYCEEADGSIDDAHGIIGSSNFTEKGLLDNAELNYLETDNVRVASIDPTVKGKTHREWFNEMWERSEPWTGRFIQEILKPSPLGTEVVAEREKETEPEPLTPYEVYIKYLQMQFGDMVDANTTEILKSYLPPTFNALEYQLDAVKQCFSVMKRFGGFILGDVVGLGKTVVGVMLIRHFLENAEVYGRAPKVLIVTPPAIKKAWVKTIADFDKNTRNSIGLCVDFVTTGSIGKLAADFEDADVDPDEDGDEIEEIKTDNYGLVLIDESHNFRNSETQKYKAIDDLIGFISPTPFVALLSATPQNNTPRDLYNQIRLFQRDPNNSTLPNVEGGKLDSFFSGVGKRFAVARAIPQDTAKGRAEAKKIIHEISEEVRRCVLNDLVVRRTRTDIKKMYGADAELLKFPTVVGPHKLEYKMDEELQQIFFNTTQAICPPAPGEPFDPNIHIGFYRYAAITQFVNPEHTKLYEKRNLTVDSITRRLKRIMQILLVKRLESSLAAFKATLENLRRYNDVMIDMLENDCVFICPDLDVNKLHAEAEGDFQKFKAAVEAGIAKKGGNNRRFRAADFKASYLKDLKGDKRLIDKLLDAWRANTEDPKFERFREAINPELFNPAINNPSGLNKPRLVIFTEAIDTLNSLTRALKNKGHRVLSITAGNRDDMQEAIEANFDANCPVEKRRDDYDVIVTTEVLAEGVNLHRSNVILNYDAPWNATRLMQRIGRVNRIGSTEEFVHVFNFFPSDEGNSQIRLIEKAYAKLQSFHEMFGEDNKVFSENEELVDHDLSRFVDGDESPFGPFINELKAFRDQSPERYAYIASVDPDALGGTLLTVAESDRGIFVFTDDTKELISVEAQIGDDAPAPRVVSSLATMQQLKCDPSARFSPAQLGDSKLYAAALRAYHKHVVHHTSSSDTDKNVKAARAVVYNLRNLATLTDESRRLLKQIDRLILGKDKFLIKQVMKFENYQESLFGADDDINALLNAALANFADRAQKKRGESKLALYSIS
ncbi:MAG: SNF2-related protein [Prevotella sp.]|nr:SNF2-related protein [Bacteroides sp.]MCM1446516.1 SNF2-related protein [Prevotella sp.]